MESETTNEFGFRLCPFGAATIGEWTVGWPLGRAGGGGVSRLGVFCNPTKEIKLPVVGLTNRSQASFQEDPRKLVVGDHSWLQIAGGVKKVYITDHLVVKLIDPLFN
jgi:hypothetical protein